MKPIVIALLVSGLLIGAALMSGRSGGDTVPTSPTAGNNVSVVNGIQIIKIDAKGGYQPRKSIAQAGLPTVIRFNTATTFDCSSAVRIPSLNITKTLPQSGSTDIEIGVPAAGPLKGSCGMGMYPFEVAFTE